MKFYRMPKKVKQINTEIGYVKPRILTEEMKDSYIDYAMSVIVSRALPDIRDGLKPVHRRILYTMWEDGLTHAAKFRKSATVVGSALGRYHPHGDIAVYDALARMAQDFSLRYPLITGQGNFGCFAKDTKVQLCDGRKLTFEELVKENTHGKKHWTFTFNPRERKIEITEIKNPRMTRKNEKIMEIMLDNGEKIKCTPDHRFMLRNGNYRKARDLKPGESLMPAYFNIKRVRSHYNYLGVLQPFTGHYEFIHRLADEYNMRDKKVRKIQGPYVLHHKDFNKFNNFSEIITKAQRYNHKVAKTRILQKREDVYDLTIKPWHNFLLSAGVFVHNSLDNDPPAAARYTEAKMSKVGEEMLRDIQKDTVDFVDNYDGTRKEPTVLPSPLPQLLLNGSLGIAVGMATNIPPHNLSEVVEATCHLVDHPQANTADLFKFVQGPDFPTGGCIFDRKEIIEAYSQGRGTIVARGKAEIIEREKTDRTQIIITEIPYQVQKSTLIEQFANLVKEKKIEGIKDIRDESDKDGMRIVIELQREAFPQKILNRLYKFTDLQKNYYLNMLALVERIQPTTLSLADVLRYFIEHRKEVVYRRTKYELEKAKERAHILEGLHKCLANIDAVIETIKSSENREAALKNLMRRFKLTQIQANAILETKLSALAKLERKKIEEELKEQLSRIKELTAILKSPQKVKEIIKKELKVLKENFGDPRRTKVYAQKAGEFTEEDLIPQEETIITLTRQGYVKRINPSLYKKQKKGGRGILGMKTLGDDIVQHFLTAQTHDNLLFFTDSGKVFQIPVYEISEGTRVAKGRGLLNFLELSPNDRVMALFALGKEDEAKGTRYLIMVTKQGIIKKTSLDEFKNVRRSGLIAISLKKGDELRQVAKTTGGDEIILVTQKGQSIHFKEKDIRSMGRTAAGIRGIRLRKGDEVVGMEVIKSQISWTRSGLPGGLHSKSQISKKEKQCLLMVTEKGFGKRTLLEEFKLQGRGGSGIIAGRVIPKTGNIASFRVVTDQEEDLIVISRKGYVIRTKINSIPKLKRPTQGVRIMRLEEGDRVVSAACI